MIRRDRLMILLIFALILGVTLVSAATIGDTAQNTWNGITGVVKDMYSAGSIFHKFFTMQRIVNYVLVFFVLYIIASFVPGIRDQFGGFRDNRVMMSIALAGVSIFVVALSVKDPYMFIWNLPFIQTLRMLFVEGRFYVFLMSGIGYYMIFNTWGTDQLKKGPMKIILTFLLAFETARSGMTKETVFQGLYFIFLFALYKSFGGGEGKAGKSKAMAVGLAFGLVNFIALTAFESYDFGLKWSIGMLFTDDPSSTLGYKTFIGNFLTGALFGMAVAANKKSAGSKAIGFAKGIGKSMKGGLKNTKNALGNMTWRREGFKNFWEWAKSREAIARAKGLRRWAEKIVNSKRFKDTMIGDLAQHHLDQIKKYDYSMHEATKEDFNKLHEIVTKMVPNFEAAAKYQLDLRRKIQDEDEDIKYAEAVITEGLAKHYLKQNKGKPRDQQISKDAAIRKAKEALRVG